MISIKNLLNSFDLTKDDLLEIIDLGNAIYKSPDDFFPLCRWKDIRDSFF